MTACSLDVTAVAWLVQYLTSLKETTVLVVSHDADFMEKVATDIVYLNVCAGGLPALVHCVDLEDR
jgi:ATPase subunit of ABC transporter with duplicated ATPase domains